MPDKVWWHSMVYKPQCTCCARKWSMSLRTWASYCIRAISFSYSCNQVFVFDSGISKVCSSPQCLPMLYLHGIPWSLCRTILADAIIRRLCDSAVVHGCWDLHHKEDQFLIYRRNDEEVSEKGPLGCDLGLWTLCLPSSYLWCYPSNLWVLSLSW